MTFIKDGSALVCFREVLTVARQYQKEGIKIDQIVIDFFHWTVQGDWKFDKTYWPDPKAMVDELHSIGVRHRRPTRSRAA